MAHGLGYGMNRIKHWHRIAMREADLADLARRRNDDWAVRAHASFAYEIEADLVQRMPASVAAAPPRSVLLQSAISLALEAGRAADAAALVTRILDDPAAGGIHDDARVLQTALEDKPIPAAAPSRADSYFENGKWYARPDLRRTRPHIAFRALIADLPAATRDFLIHSTCQTPRPPLSPAKLDAHCAHLIDGAGIAYGRDGFATAAEHEATCRSLAEHRRLIGDHFVAESGFDRTDFVDFADGNFDGSEMDPVVALKPDAA